jgi:hypothetical protein
LTAVNGIGAGPTSNEARTISASLAGTAQNVKATGSGSGLVLLTWDPPLTTGGLPVTSYELQISPDGSTWTPSAVSSSTFSKMFTNLVDGRTYFFRVIAITSAGRGATAAAIGIPSTVADAPTNVLGAVSGDRRVTLSWTAPTNTGGTPITDYRIDYSIDGGVTWTRYATGNAFTSTSLNINSALQR